MEDLNIRTKISFVKAFKNNNSPYGNMTINELIDVFQKQLDTNERLKTEHEESVIKKYTNKFFKKYEDNNLFGKKVNVLKIDGLETSSYTTDYDRTYLLKGCRFNISKSNLYFREFDTSVDSMYTENKLNSYTEITEKEYNEFLLKYKEVSTQLNSLIEP